MVNTKICQYPPVEVKYRLIRITVIFPLRAGIFNILPCILIFEFKGNNGYAVYRQKHINGFSVMFGIVPLTDTMTDILFIEHISGFIQMWFGLEKADFETDTPVFKAVTHNGNQPVHFNGIVKGITKLFCRLTVTAFFKPCPFFRLCTLYKIYQRIHIQTFLFIIGIICFCITALSRNQKTLYITFKSFFGRVHLFHLFFTCHILIYHGFFVVFHFGQQLFFLCYEFINFGAFFIKIVCYFLLFIFTFSSLMRQASPGMPAPAFQTAVPLPYTR